MAAEWGPLFTRRVIQAVFFCSFLLKCKVSPTFLYIAAVSDNHIHQLVRQLHPNTSVPALYAHFLELWQSPVSPKFQIPCSDFVHREVCSRFLLRISSAVHCATHVPVLQCLPAIVINS